MKIEKKYIAIPIILILFICFAVSISYLCIDNPNPKLKEWKARTNKLILSYYKVQFVYNDDNSQTLEITDKNEIDYWLKNIETEIYIHPPFSYQVCACKGNPIFKLYEGDKFIAEISIHTGSIRSEQLGLGDVPLKKSKKDKLQKEFANLGIEEYIRLER